MAALNLIIWITGILTLLALASVLTGLFIALLVKYKKPILRALLVMLYVPVVLITSSLSFIGKRI
ncbi:hypothetical protein QUW45_09480 [Limosilactobacillus pontis]|uniref:hypothetical protein n=1 Tax=Limosilactobacillus pontis TaxID=35787 RepID=UPI0025A3C405|nr:hypothetical protein [Limosilactobacillus pontis]MDM8332883.1 hypothetical protein [Limosilactobacillus pontis]